MKDETISIDKAREIANDVRASSDFYNDLNGEIVEIREGYCKVLLEKEDSITFDKKYGGFICAGALLSTLEMVGTAIAITKFRTDDSGFALIRLDTEFDEPADEDVIFEGKVVEDGNIKKSMDINVYLKDSGTEIISAEADFAVSKRI